MSMAMGSSTMSMPMSATSTASGMSSTMTGMSGMSGMSGMDGMDMDSSMMSMADMMMVFFTSTSTPLYSKAWTPSSTGAYAGTCIFLIALTVVLHTLLAVRSNLPAVLGWATHRSQTDILRSDYDKISGGQGLVAGPVKTAAQRPWRINEAVTRALLDTVVAGVAYLL